MTNQTLVWIKFYGSIYRTPKDCPFFRGGVALGAEQLTEEQAADLMKSAYNLVESPACE